MTQYDAAATSMWRCFSKTPDNAAFTSLPSNIDLNEVNPGGTRLAAMARGLNLSEIDRAPDELVNAMLRKAVKGGGVRVSAPVRAAFVNAGKKDGDD